MKSMITILSLVLSCSITAQSPDSTQYFYGKGMDKFSAKLYSQAAKDFEKAIAINPKFTDAHLQYGFTNLAMLKQNAAILNFTSVIELDPQNLIAKNELMKLHYNYRQYDKVIELAQSCKECSDVKRIIALCYYQKEDFGKAEKNLVAVFEKDNRDAEVAYALGRTYMELENSNSTIEYYEKAVGLNPGNIIWLNELGLIYYTVGNFKNAAVYFNKAAAGGFTQSNDFTENLAFSYLYSGEVDKGEKLLSSVLERKPGNTELIRDIADAFYQTKLYDKSLEYYQKLMEKDTKDAKALYQAGICFQKKGEVEKGRAMCDKAIELDPSLNRLKRQQTFSAGL
jgi:tetratricopeptide (TPR) repeat protein